MNIKNKSFCDLDFESQKDFILSELNKIYNHYYMPNIEKICKYKYLTYNYRKFIYDKSIVIKNNDNLLD